jgi:hypothetical protein
MLTAGPWDVIAKYIAPFRSQLVEYASLFRLTCYSSTLQAIYRPQIDLGSAVCEADRFQPHPATYVE